MHTHRRGFGKVELIVGLACIIIVLVVAFLVLRAGRPGSVWHQRDAAQLRGIHQAMLVHASAFDGLLPRPGLIAPKPSNTLLGEESIPGRGEEEHRHNNTADMYALMVAMNYVSADVLVSPHEPNPNVRVYEDAELSSGFDASRPWPNTFQADLTRLSHVSYANLFMFGERFDRYWRETLDSSVPVLGNRGPADGLRDRNSYTTSNGHWSGYVVAGDHSLKLQTAMTPAWLTFAKDGRREADNLFALDDGLLGKDIVLTFTRNASSSGAERHHD